MVKTVIATVPLPDLRLIVWFEGGLSRHYDATEFGITRESTNSSVAPLKGGCGICWKNGVTVPTEDLEVRGEEIDLADQERYRLLTDVHKVRCHNGISQTKLGVGAGVRQSVISRIEGGEVSPQLITILKILAPLGKTLEIVDLEDTERKPPSRKRPT